MGSPRTERGWCLELTGTVIGALPAAGYRGTRVTWRQLEDIPEEIAADLRDPAPANKYKRP